MKEDIKIAERTADMLDKTYVTGRSIEATAIRNLINRNKELEAINRMQEYRINEMDIPKSKVREKIEWIERNILENDYASDEDCDIAEYQVQALQELLQEGDDK